MTRHVLICAPVLPEYDRESGSRRIFHLIEFLREAGWAVSFVARHASAGERYIRHLQQHGVAVYVGFDVRMEQLIGAGRFDLAILAFWHVAEELLPIIRRLSPGTVILVDSIDLHFLRNARETFHKRGDEPLPLLDERFASDMRRELNVYAAADGILTVSPKEAQWINDLTSDPALAHALPDAEEIPLSDVPFRLRRGILFVGNFRHAPNVEAVEFLCREVVPLVSSAVLAEHPVSIVGNGLNEKICDYGRAVSNVKMVGWVPSVLPYLNQARVGVLPLLYGAGTKRKLIQSLMVGTPTVSTTIGIEGFNLQDGEHALVADDPYSFATAIERLLTDEQLWGRLALQGRQHVLALHGREMVRARLRDVLSVLCRRRPKHAPGELPRDLASDKENAYQQLLERLGETLGNTLPTTAKALVISKGDDTLLELAGIRAEHFPQADEGVYAGHHPSSSAAAIAHLQAMQSKGSEYLIVPATSFWWLDHYREFAQHLDTACQCIFKDDDCAIYRLAPSIALKDSTGAGKNGARTTPRPLPKPNLSLDPRSEVRRMRAISSKKVLVCGVYLASVKNTAEHLIEAFGQSARHEVHQCWVALGGEPPRGSLADVTVRTIKHKVPKFQIMNELLADTEVGAYDYVLLADDDIVLPDGFLDQFIALQEEFAFAIAQPARTSNSYIDHPIVEQQHGVLARRTLFVEIGPVVSFHSSAHDLVFPFNLTSPMGWGYENVWSYRLAKRGLRMGIIDAVPVDHSLRKPVANYSWADADRQRKALLAAEPHYPLDCCFRVLEAFI